jgi:hypothetical protein
MLVSADRNDMAWRVACDQAVNELLRLSGDDGLWLSPHQDVSLQVTEQVVRGLMAYQPWMPATQSHYIRHVLARTVDTVQSLRQQDGTWGEAEQTARAVSILNLVATAA